MAISAEVRIEKLKKELARLRQVAHARKASVARGRKEHEPTPTPQERLRRVVVAPGIALTTIIGSLYSSICKVLAALGHLARHDELFREFLKSPTAEAAHHLFGQIGVRRTDIDEYVHADEDFQEHCEKRTRQYKNLAARGSRKHAAILRNPQIASNGQWIGDIDEALSILAVGRTIRQVRHGKNQRILNRATVPLMFDTMTVGDEQVCFLYPQKWHAGFLQAKALVNP